MREIKFRVWDFDNQRMFNDCFSHEKFGSTIWVQFQKDASKNLEWMQYTGLVDERAIPIYEGDIVKAKHQKLAIVIWDIEHACFCTQTIDDVIKDERQYCMSDIIEVKGNIHQHPELLTPKQ